MSRQQALPASRTRWASGITGFKANLVLKGLVDEWAAKNKVDVTIDFIASAGNKMILTQAAEAQARSGMTSLPSTNGRPPVR